MIEVLDALDIDQEPYLLAVPRRGRPAQKRARGSAVLAVHVPPPFEQANLLRSRIEFERGAFAVEQRRLGLCRHRPELHDHGNAAGSRQHRDVARRAAAKQCKAAAARPVDFQELRRRQIVGADDRAGRNLEGIALAAAQRANDAIAQIRQIGRARPKILIGRGIVVCDLRVESGRPRRVGRRPGANRRKDRIEKVLVFQQSNLKFEDLRGLAARGVGQCG